ncbi:hypothetical protein TH63_06950 [Rufibacter radiotolerans]|uniref:Uncharacterized protein n=1 Tax=Rufibacter radiotolerans TaxID=1379910 RepID=A0A0H4W4T3_9BACT|nr:hypothetical protein [Rufibacter radiotolerans]AKQ45436.1 hypothetical protein TH63_06950 [Rufibacter radiotolerans]
MTQCLVPAATYLSYAEAADLYQALQEVDVPVLVKSCGPPTLPYGEGKYFQLLVPEDALLAAQPLLEAFSVKQAQNAQLPFACPKCRSLDVGPRQNLAWWRKLLYAGTTLYRCLACRHSFFT